MNCAEIEILICDYVDGTLAPEARAAVERHLAECPACAEMARDSASAVAFMARAADVEPPPELVTHLLFESPWHKAKAGWFSGIFNSILQPKFALSMAMTILSLSMLWRPFHQLDPSDLQPSKVWAGLEDRAYRVWGRTVKFYDNLKFVYQIQTTLREWQQDQETQTPAADADGQKPDEHQLPVRNNSSPRQESKPGDGTK